MDINGKQKELIRNVIITTPNQSTKSAISTLYQSRTIKQEPYQYLVILMHSDK